MKIVQYLSLAVALSGPSFAWAAFGEPPENPTPNLEGKPQDGLRHLDNSGSPRVAAEPMGPVERSSKLIGSTVKDASGEKVGKVRDLTIDLEGGRVVQVIIASGGILGVGGKHVALPPTTLSVDASGEVTTRITLQKITDAPEFDLEKWLDGSRPDQVSAMYRYYEVEPRLVPRHGRQDAGRLPGADTLRTATAGPIERATKLVGLTVVQESGAEVGKVDDLVVDLSTARVPIVVVSTGGFLGVGDDLSAIPPSLFRYESGRSQVVLQVAKESLQTAPRFKGSQWSEYATSDKFREAYRAYGVKPYFEDGSAPDNSRQFVRDREPGDLTPLDQGNSESDIKTTADIRRSVTRDDGLSVAAQNVKIITLNGRVTLRGQVKSSTEKERIEALAKSVAGDGKVDSQLEVKADGADK